MSKMMRFAVVAVAAAALTGSVWADSCGGEQKRGCGKSWGKGCGAGQGSAKCAKQGKGACMKKGDSSCGAGQKGACAMTEPKAQGKAESEAEHGYGKIDTVGLKGLVDSGVSVTLVDARTPKYDDGRRIPGAVYLPAGSSKAEIESALPSKDALIVTYCSNLKCPASAKLADQLVALGYKNVLKYPEGLAGWMDAGHDVSEKMASVSDG